MPTRSFDLDQVKHPEAGARMRDVLARLRSDILCFQLVPGEPISERELEDAYAASRTPIRAVLAQLVADGLVIRTARGHAVAPFDLQEIEEIFEFRETAEAASVRLACLRAEPAEIDAIQAEIDQSLQAFTPDSWMEAGLDFHVRVAALSRNRFVVDAVRRATIRTLRARWLVANSDEGRRASHVEHAAILKHIRAGNTEAAECAAVAHSQAIQAQVVAAVEAARPILGRRGIAGQPGQSEPGEKIRNGTRKGGTR